MRGQSELNVFLLGIRETVEIDNLVWNMSIKDLTRLVLLKLPIYREFYVESFGKIFRQSCLKLSIDR
jgi:hypothetical protein